MLLARLLVSALALAVPASASAYVTDRPWPPAKGPGDLFAHYGEEHWNDDDGLTLLPKVVEEVVRYRPALVTMSGDKVNDGTRAELQRWEDIMAAYDRAGIPYFAATGNHDRDSGVAGTPPPGTLDAYLDVFRDRPYPFGDGPAPPDERVLPRERPAGDPAGAATHYFVDYGGVRFVYVDNSCWAIEECDGFQAPSAQTRPGEGQLAFLQRVAKEASDAGRLVFVVMHMATRDPGDPSHRSVTGASPHIMGKGAGTDDNAKFEQAAEAAGVDAVLVAHIKGQFLYTGLGGIPYFIDGGAGGELYTDGPVGTDHGYWHGFRLIRVAGTRFATDAVPIFMPDGIRIEGPERVARGENVHLEAFGKQPVFVHTANVDALELRDPDPRPRAGGGSASLAGLGRWALLPGMLLLLLGLAARTSVLARGGLLAVVALAGGTIAVAQQSEPTATKRENLPNPARMWTTSDPDVLAPVAAESDDPRRDAESQTISGVFRALCPGTTTIEIASGFEAQRKQIVSLSRSGPIVRRISRGSRTAGRGARRLAAVRVAQPAEVVARVKRGRRTVRTLVDDCVGAARSIHWSGLVRRGGRFRRARRGAYTLEVRVQSDRRPVVRRFRFRLR